MSFHRSDLNFTNYMTNSYDKHDLTIGHCNIQGGYISMLKSTEVISLIRKHEMDLIGLNETNLNDTIDSSTLNIPSGYNLVRKDRGKGSRGGCAVLVSKNCAHVEIEMNTTVDNIEAIWIKIKSINLYVCCFYRSTKLCKIDKFLDYMVECMSKIRGKRVIWLGDINLDQNKINSPDYKRLDTTLKSFNLVQTIQEMTRIAKRGNKITATIIDVIFTNCYSDIIKSEVLDEKIGDHQALKCQLDFKVAKAAKYEKVEIRDFCMINKTAYYEYLKSTDFSPILLSDSAEESANGLNHHLNSQFDNFFPLKTITVHQHFIYKPSRESLNAIKDKRKFYKKFKAKLAKVISSGCERCGLCSKCKKSLDAWNVYKEVRNKSNMTTRNNKKENLMKDLKAKSAKNDLKGVWRTIKAAANMAPKSNKQPASGSALDAEQLNTHFSTIGSSIKDSIPRCEYSVDEFLENVPQPTSKMNQFETVTEEEVLNYVKSIANDKAIADNIPVKIYKTVVNAIIEPLAHIINLSLKNGTVPQLCKIATVTAIHKGGDKDDLNNYRPISILPLVGKCIEFFVNQQILLYFEENKLFSNDQYGFRKNHSTTFLMCNLMDNLYNSKDSGCTPSVIFLDIKKAFDTVDHKILIKKLKFYGVDGTVLLWIENYLTGRYQATKSGGKVSLLKLIMCGVPQGSILGPLLFSIFINDLTYICHLSKPSLFADDGALFFEDTCRHSYLAIRLELVTVMKWLQANKLALNTDKTNFMVFDSSKNVDNITLENGATIHEVKSVKYLGLMLDSGLKFNDHVDYVKKKVLKRIGAMYRAGSLLSKKFRKMFANSLMLPQFDYLDTIYSRANKTKLAELDILYKRVAKNALGVEKTESSINVYKDMGWLPLHLRRQLHLSSYTFKTIKDYCPRNMMDKFSYMSGGSRSSENCDLSIPKSKSFKQFSFQAAKCWNILPADLRKIDNPSNFSKFLKARLLKSAINDTNYSINNGYDFFYQIVDSLI